MLFQPLFLQYLYILLVILLISKTKILNYFQILNAKKLTDFQWYKTQFLITIMLREDSNQPFWKEKFVAGLPHIISKKVKTCIRKQYGNKNFYHKKLQKEMSKTGTQLWAFCSIFDMTKDCCNDCTKLPIRRKTKLEKPHTLLLNLPSAKTNITKSADINIPKHQNLGWNPNPIQRSPLKTSPVTNVVEKATHRNIVTSINKSKNFS